jgi:hypothetical protein
MVVSIKVTLFSSGKVPRKSIGQVTAGFGEIIAFVDAQMLGGFSVIPSYAEMKLEVLSMASGCGQFRGRPPKRSRELWPLAWAKERPASERFQDSRL